MAGGLIKGLTAAVKGIGTAGQAGAGAARAATGFGRVTQGARAFWAAAPEGSRLLLAGAGGAYVGNRLSA